MRRLRSSPGPETGCSVHLGAQAGGRAGRCDPHPVRRPGAAPRRSGYRPHHAARCDPHPVRRPGAAGARGHPPERTVMLRSSPGPETGCSKTRLAAQLGGDALRSSPGPETGCSAGDLPMLPPRHQRCDPHPVRRPGAAVETLPPWLHADHVAILTRSEDRVQPRPFPSGWPASTTLRSSPGPKTGCSIQRPPPWRLRSSLRSSPGPKTGCSRQHPLPRLHGLPGCDPHPVRRPGAASPPSRRCCSRSAVAILTRSEDRVQRVRPLPPPQRRAQLRSSPGPKTGCSSPAQLSLPGRPRCCDPHPVRRPGAARHRTPRRPVAAVAILTRSEDRVQPAAPAT